MADCKSEGKYETKEDAMDSLLLRVARFFQGRRDENAFYGGDRNGGVETLFEDFLDQHVEEFMHEESKGDDDGNDGFTHTHQALHEAYLREFEKSCEWAVEVEGGTYPEFYAACKRELENDSFGRHRAASPELSWFLDATLAAMDFRAFFRLMRAKAEVLETRARK